jgi:hypothetical protein
LQLENYASSLGPGAARNVLFAAIAGDPAPVEVQLVTPPGGGEPRPAIGSVCAGTATTQPVIAQPGVRIAAAAETFRRHVLASACADSYVDPMIGIARHIRSLIGDPCLTTDVALPVDCEAADELVDGPRITIPACSDTMTEDCFTLVDDATCSTSHHLRVDVTRTTAAPIGSLLSVRCRM